MPPELQELFARLGELSRDELTDLQSQLAAAGEDLADSTDADSITALGAIADAYEAVGTRIVEVQAEADELATRREAALGRLRPPADDASTDDSSSDDASSDSSGAADGEGLAASGRTAARPAGRLPAMGTVGRTQAPPTPAFTPTRATTAIVAAADVQGVGAGDAFASFRQLAESFDARRAAVSRSRGGVVGEKVPVATFRTTFPEDRFLGQNGRRNDEIIREHTAPEVMVAAAEAARAGGALVAAALCAPIEQLYDVPDVLGVVDRPIRDALAQFGADRGGVAWRPAPRFGDLDAASGFWTMEDDEDTDAEKGCLEVVCPTGDEAVVEALYTCLKFRNVATRFDPEMTQANIDAAMIAAARRAENRLISKIAATSTTVTTGVQVSATRDLLVAVDKVTAAYRWQHRLNGNVPLRALFPQWVRETMRSDLCRGFGSDESPEALAYADEQIAAFFTRRNLNITWHLDGRPAIVAATNVPAMPLQGYGAFTEGGAVPNFPTAVEWFLYPEGTILYLDGGQLDLGIVRDAALVAENAYKSFTEEWFGLANRAEESLRVVSSLRPNGAIVGTIDPATVTS